MKYKLPLATAMLTAALLGGAHAADKLDASCASCHALTKPTDTSLERLISRKGPDLWYAGSKFNADWLVTWQDRRNGSGNDDESCLHDGPLRVKAPAGRRMRGPRF